MTDDPDIQVGSSRRSVLVVDDEEELADYLAQVFSEHDWHATTAADGFEALEKLRQMGAADLLVLDLGLPRMSGIELARKIRSRYPGVRIIVSTGYNVRFEADELQALNIRRVLAKPYGLDVLIEAAETALG